MPNRTASSLLPHASTGQAPDGTADSAVHPPALRALLLGGTSEAWELAASLAARPDVITISSLAGRVQQPRVPQGIVRIGGFGGVKGLIGFLQTEQIGAVIDATHPFAVRISRNAEDACRELGLPLFALGRKEWSSSEKDDWHEVADCYDAAELVDRTAGRVFLSIGRQELEAFAGCRRASFLIRAIEKPEAPLPVNHTLLLERGPFDLDHELNLLRKYSIERVVSKNSGGSGTYAKIVAARMLKIPVVMIRRPVKHTVQTLCSVEQICRALQGLVDAHFRLLRDGMEAEG
jgi:precorrin-6A/cobalt-precorrin-6A reductase